MSELERSIKYVRRFLKERIQRDFTTFRGHTEEWKNIYELLKRTAELGESNSLLLIGPRGSGKTTLIASVLNSLIPESDFNENVVIVYLNGLTHTDDRIALKSITAQMNLERAVDGKVFRSFAENLSYLLASLKSGNKRSKSIIFILDEFDMFCAHHNQTLLYNLFDVSQSAQAPLCVLGITCRLDVIELLEKRVKSRFSHRQIFLFPDCNKFDDRLELFKELLSLPSGKDIKLKAKPKANLDLFESSELYFLKNLFDPTGYNFSKNMTQSWNKQIESISQQEDVRKGLRRLYDYDVSEAFFKTFLYKVVSRLDEHHSMILPDDITQNVATFELDDKVLLLCGLSVLELSLIIAIKHHSEIYDRDPFNFEIIYTRFIKFARTSSSMQGAERPVALKAFEHIKNLEFIVPLNITASKVQKEFQMHKLLLTYGQINLAVKNFDALPTEVAQWALSSII